MNVTYASMAYTGGSRTCYGIYRAPLILFEGHPDHVRLSDADLVATEWVDDTEIHDTYALAQAHEVEGWPAWEWPHCKAAIDFQKELRAHVDRCLALALRT